MPDDNYYLEQSIRKATQHLRPIIDVEFQDKLISICSEILQVLKEHYGKEKANPHPTD